MSEEARKIRDFFESLGEFLNNPSVQKDVHGKFNAEIHITDKSRKTAADRNDEEKIGLTDMDRYQPDTDTYHEGHPNALTDILKNSDVGTAASYAAIIVGFLFCAFLFAKGVIANNTWQWSGWGLGAIFCLAWFFHFKDNALRAKKDHAVWEAGGEEDSTTVNFYERTSLRVTSALLLLWLVVKFFF